MERQIDYGLFAHLLLKAMQRQDGQRMSDQIVEKLRKWDESFQYHEAKMKKLDSTFPESVLEFLLTHWAKQMTAKGYILKQSPKAYLWVYAPNQHLVVEQKDKDVLETLGFRFATRPKPISDDERLHAQWYQEQEGYVPPPRDRKPPENAATYRKMCEQKS